MIEMEVDIKTRDGVMNSFVTHPEEGGPFPPVLFYMDAPGKREELHSWGFCVESWHVLSWSGGARTPGDPRQSPVPVAGVKTQDGAFEGVSGRIRPDWDFARTS